MKNSAALAHSITWKSSKQSYLTALFLADRGLVNDCLRAYAYFRWVDDKVDISLRSDADRSAFISRQKRLIAGLYAGELFSDLCPEERMLSDLVAHDRRTSNGLNSFINNFMAVIEFDGARKGRMVHNEELAAYTAHLASAVMDGLQYFIGNGFPYLETADRLKAVTGAHVTHMLRDMLEDLPAGIINIPIEAVMQYGISTENLDRESFRSWVRGQVEKARNDFEVGQAYISSLPVLRCKLAGVWYLARFECVLDDIQREDCKLRYKYPERHSLSSWIKMFFLGMKVCKNHLLDSICHVLPEFHRLSVVPPSVGIRSYHSSK